MNLNLRNEFALIRCSVDKGIHYRDRSTDFVFSSDSRLLQRRTSTFSSRKTKSKNFSNLDLLITYYMYVYVYVYVYMYMCIYVYVYVYMYICICIYLYLTVILRGRDGYELIYITNEAVGRVGYYHLISVKSEKNNCFSKFSSNSLDFFG